MKLGTVRTRQLFAKTLGARVYPIGLVANVLVFSSSDRTLQIIISGKSGVFRRYLAKVDKITVLAGLRKPQSRHDNEFKVMVRNRLKKLFQ